MQKPTKHFVREVRRARHLSAWIVLNRGTDRECQVMDISSHGAKVVVQIPSDVPARFELSFLQNDKKRRICEVIWRRGKMLGVKFTA
jgi:hypothetical protein